MDQGSNKNHSPAYNFTPTVTKFCVMWEGLSLPHDTKFGNCRCKIVDSRSFHSWSLIHGLRWSGLIKVGPGHCSKHYRLNLAKYYMDIKTNIQKRFQKMKLTLGNKMPSRSIDNSIISLDENFRCRLNIAWAKVLTQFVYLCVNRWLFDPTMPRFRITIRS